MDTGGHNRMREQTPAGFVRTENSLHPRLEGNIFLGMPTSWRVLGFGFAILLVILAGILWFGNYSRVAVVPGAISVDRGVAMITPTRPGLIQIVFVREGAEVEAGAPIIAVRTEDDLQDGTTASARVKRSLEDEVNRLNDQEMYASEGAAATRRRLEEQVRGLGQVESVLATQINEQGILVEFAQAELRRANEIALRGFLSKRDLESKEADVATRRQQLAALQQQLASVSSQLAAARKSIAEAAATAGGQIQSLRTQRSALEREAAQADFSRGYILKAPFAGTVTGVLGRAGQDVQAGQQLALIIPRGAKTQAELYVSSAAVGFVQRGQRVKLAVDAFPFQTFGTIEGTIRNVSKAAVMKTGTSGEAISYLTTVDLDRTYINAFGRQQPLLPGMTLSARVTTRKQSLVEWLFDPLYAVTSR